MFLDMCSSSKKGETRTFGGHTRTIVKVQSHSEEKQTDAFGELEIRIGAITISCLVISWPDVISMQYLVTRLYSYESLLIPNLAFFLMFL